MLTVAVLSSPACTACMTVSLIPVSLHSSDLTALLAQGSSQYQGTNTVTVELTGKLIVLVKIGRAHV